MNTVKIVNTKLAEVVTQREAFVATAQREVDKQLAYFAGQEAALRGLLPAEVSEAPKLTLLPGAEEDTPGA